MQEDKLLLQALKDLYKDNPQKLESIIAKAKEDVVMREITAFYHLVVCNSKHGMCENECRYYIEEGYEHPWDGEYHKRWRTEAQSFIKGLIKNSVLSDPSEFSEMLVRLKEFVRAVEELKLNYGDGAVITAISLASKSLKYWEVKIRVSKKESEVKE